MSWVPCTFRHNMPQETPIMIILSTPPVTNGMKITLLIPGRQRQKYDWNLGLHRRIIVDRVFGCICNTRGPWFGLCFQPMKALQAGSFQQDALNKFPFNLTLQRLWSLMSGQTAHDLNQHLEGWQLPKPASPSRSGYVIKIHVKQFILRWNLGMGE